MVEQLLNDLEEDNIIPVKQDESKAVYDRWEEDLRFVDLKKEPPLVIHNKIRGLRPFYTPLLTITTEIIKSGIQN